MARSKAGGHVGTATPLFNRIDAEKMLEEIEKETSVSEAALEEKKEEIPGVAMIGIDDFAKKSSSKLQKLRIACRKTRKEAA